MDILIHPLVVLNLASDEQSVKHAIDDLVVCL
jgi:hypothetical protein